MQELLLKDLPDSSQAMHYNRRSSPNGPPVPKVNCSGNGVRGCLDKHKPRDRPRVVVKGLTAAWEKGEVSVLRTVANDL